MARNTYATVMKICSAVAVICAIYAALTYGQGVIHSDSAVTNRLFYSMKASGGFYPKTWNFYNYELYAFTVQNIGAYIQFIINNTIAARVITSALLLLLACYSLVWFSKNILGDISYVVTLPVIFIFMSDVNYRDMFLYQADYVIQVLVLTLCYGMADRIIIKQEKSLKYIIIHSILLFLLMLGGMRYGAEYVLPFSSMVGANWLYHLFKKENKTVIALTKRYLLLFGVPTAVGLLLYKIVCHSRASHILGNQVGTLDLDFSIKSIAMNTHITIFNVLKVFGYTPSGLLIKNVFAIILAVVLFFVLPVVQLIDVKKLKEEELNYTIFALAHNAVLIGVIILGAKTYERYLFTSIFAAVIVSANCLNRRLLKNTGIIKYILGALFICLTLFYSIELIRDTSNWKQIVAKQEEACQFLLDKGVNKVYASYWIAYPYEIYSNNKIKAGAIDLKNKVLHKNYILTDDGSFNTDKGKSAIVMTEDEANQFISAMHSTVGKNYKRYIIKDAIVSNNENYIKSNVIAYIFNEDVGDKLTDGFRDGRLDIKEMEYNDPVIKKKNLLILPNNGLVHGPYSFLEQGHYSLRIEGKGLLGSNCAITSEIAQDSISYTITAREDDHVDIDLVLVGGIEDLQVCLSNLTPDKAVNFYDVKVTKL